MIILTISQHVDRLMTSTMLRVRRLVRVRFTEYADISTIYIQTHNKYTFSQLL